MFRFIHIAEARDCFCQFRNEGPEKTRNKKMETQPHAYTREDRSALLPISALALKISQVFVPQVWSITLLLPERISLHSAAKIVINSKTTKIFHEKINFFGLLFKSIFKSQLGSSGFCCQNHTYNNAKSILSYYKNY